MLSGLTTSEWPRALADPYCSPPPDSCDLSVLSGTFVTTRHGHGHPPRSRTPHAYPEVSAVHSRPVGFTLTARLLPRKASVNLAPFVAADDVLVRTALLGRVLHSDACHPNGVSRSQVVSPALPDCFCPCRGGPSHPFPSWVLVGGAPSGVTPQVHARLPVWESYLFEPLAGCLSGALLISLHHSIYRWGETIASHFSVTFVTPQHDSWRGYNLGCIRGCGGTTRPVRQARHTEITSPRSSRPASTVSPSGT